LTPKQTNYQKGVKYERLLQKYLYSQGYDVVTRSAGSHGPIDLVAQNTGIILNIQVKSGDVEDDDENLQEFWRLAREDLCRVYREWQLWHHIKGNLWHVTTYGLGPFEFRMPSMSKPRRKKVEA
jgi:Holliday junction resolvase-like predicted endonuclease